MTNRCRVTKGKRLRWAFHRNAGNEIGEEILAYRFINATLNENGKLLLVIGIMVAGIVRKRIAIVYAARIGIKAMPRRTKKVSVCQRVQNSKENGKIPNETGKVPHAGWSLYDFTNLVKRSFSWNF
jgi:hypothetical protein